MACPHCESTNTRPAEQGLLKDTYYCLNCSKSFERMSNTARGGIAATLGTAIGGPVVGGILWVLFGGGDDAGGGSS